MKRHVEHGEASHKRQRTDDVVTSSFSSSSSSPSSSSSSSSSASSSSFHTCSSYIFTNAPLVDVVDFLTGGGREEGTAVTVARWAQCRALVDESEDLLSGIAEKWEELIWFYFSKGLHQKVSCSCLCPSPMVVSSSTEVSTH